MVILWESKTSRQLWDSPDKFEIYLHKNGDTFEGDFKDYHYWLNKARYTIAKGAVGEIGYWFKECLKKANTKKP